MIRPPTIAPGTEVKPPSTSTGSAFSATISSANDTSERAPHMIPAARATTPAANQTMTQIWFSEMPTDSAALWLSATARRARPMRVFWKNTASTATMIEAMTAAAMSIFWNDTRPPSISTSMTPRGRPSCAVIIALGLPPNTSSPKPMRK